MFTIRRCLLGDAEALVKLATSTFNETYFKISPENKDIYALYVQEIFNLDKIKKDLVQAENSFYFIEESSELPVGYAKTVKTIEPTQLELEKLYISSSHHGQGLGLKLLEFIKESAQSAGYKSLRLSVYDKNHHAIAFYTKLGFQKTGEKDFVLNSNGKIHKERDWLMELNFF